MASTAMPGCMKMVMGEDVFTALVELGRLEQLNADVVYAPAVIGKQYSVTGNVAARPLRVQYSVGFCSIDRGR